MKVGYVDTLRCPLDRSRFLRHMHMHERYFALRIAISITLVAIQLFKWWATWDLNPEPSGYEPATLTIVLMAQIPHGISTMTNSIPDFQ